MVILGGFCSLEMGGVGCSRGCWFRGGWFLGCFLVFWGIAELSFLGIPGMSFGGYSGNDILLVSCQNYQFPVIESASVYEVFLFFCNSKLC